MEIKLYNTTSEKNRLDKTLTTVATLNGVLKSDSSIINPVIMIERNAPTGFNYVKITDFNRYYFVNDIVVNRNKLMTISLNIDVLMSYKDEIKTQNIIIDKSTSDYDLYLRDENLKTNVKTKTDIKQFPSGLSSNGTFILITAGGEGSNGN